MTKKSQVKRPARPKIGLGVRQGETMHREKRRGGGRGGGGGEGRAFRLFRISPPASSAALAAPRSLPPKTRRPSSRAAPSRRLALW
eukprot:6044731-Pyramimonas_sp.AAC.1